MKFNNVKLFIMIILSLYLPLNLLSVSGCSKQYKESENKSLKPIVTATIFPVYDFTRSIAGQELKVEMLLPPGSETHHFEPKPSDIAKIASSRLIIYTNKYMEPWLFDMVKSRDLRNIRLLDAGKGVSFNLIKDASEDSHIHAENSVDPHTWLDFNNALVMVDNIAEALSAEFPEKKSEFAKNSLTLKSELKELDTVYQKSLSSCGNRNLLHGGHYMFGYMAKRYALDYVSAAGVSSESEPTPSKIASLVDQVEKTGSKAIFTSEMLSPRISSMISNESGCKVLELHGAHTVSKSDFEKGVTFTSIMRKNLANLQIGLGCR